MHRFGDKVRYWPTFAIFHIPPALDAPDKGNPSEFLYNISYEKNRMARLTEAEKVRG